MDVINLKLECYFGIHHKINLLWAHKQFSIIKNVILTKVSVPAAPTAVKNDNFRCSQLQNFEKKNAFRVSDLMLCNIVHLQTPNVYKS